MLALQAQPALGRKGKKMKTFKKAFKNVLLAILLVAFGYMALLLHLATPSSCMFPSIGYQQMRMGGDTNIYIGNTPENPLKTIKKAYTIHLLICHLIEHESNTDK